MPITYEFIEAKIFWDFFQEARKVLFETNFDFDVQAVLSEKEKLKSRELNEVFKPVKDYYIVAKDGDKIIGWSFGIQKSNHDFYMINSAVFKEYRRKGIYTELLHRAVAHIQELGFQFIYSRHKLTNNDMFGNLVILGYYANEKRRELLEIRAGMRKMNEEYMKLVK
jgi:N-acetylglutamate synthase-like GNAT family acetyltransferase